MYALCSDAMLKAITRQARAVDEKVKAHNAAHAPITVAYFFDHFATEQDTAVMVTEQDFVDAHAELIPSVSADEIGHYERVRRMFEGAGKKDEQASASNAAANPRSASYTLSQGSRGNGKAGGAGDSDDDYVIRTAHLDVNGAGKGKGKAAVAQHGKSDSVGIAEGGFGDAAQDEDLYS